MYHLILTRIVSIISFDIYHLGNCLEVFEGKVIKHNCNNFSSGCPEKHFYEYEFFKCKFFSKKKRYRKIILKMGYSVCIISCYIGFRIFDRPCLPKYQHRVSLLFCGSGLSSHSKHRRIFQLYHHNFYISGIFDSRRYYWYHRGLSLEKKK